MKVVVTGGPGAGKTALLEMAQRVSCQHVVFLPESASIVFGGGFPRLRDPQARRCSQRSIFHIQDQLETLADTREDVSLVMCDRGTLDEYLAKLETEADADPEDETLQRALMKLANEMDEIKSALYPRRKPRVAPSAQP